jgi:hypothetical protein
MKTRALNFTTFKVKTIYVFFLIALATILNLFSACTQDDGPKPIAPIAPLASEDTELIHKVPDVPVILDGAPASPDIVLQYNGKPLYYVVDEKSMQEGVIRIFTDEQKASAYRQQAEIESALGDKGSRTAATEGFTAKIYIYEESNYSGYSNSFALGNTDLYNLSTYNFDCNWLGNNCHNMNNKISSIKCSSMPKHWTVLFSATEYQGSKLWIAPGANRAYLSWYGFNDITSSIGFVPYSLH